MNKSLSFILSCMTFAFYLQTESAIIRKYDPVKDYQAARVICSQHWKEFEERDPLCTGGYDTLLLELTPFAFSPQVAKKLKAKVLSSDSKVIGVLFYCSPMVAPGLLVEQGIIDDDSYAELSYVGIHNEEQRKGYGTQLFNKLRRELTVQGRVQTILSRANPSSQSSIAWHLKQGFMRLTEQNAHTAFEEAALIEGEARGQTVFKLDLRERETENWPTLKEYFKSNRKKIIREADQQSLNSLGQAKIVRKIAQQTVDVAPIITEDERAYVVHQYLKRSLDRKTTQRIFVYAFGKEKARKAKSALLAIFDYVDARIDYLETELYSDPDVSDLLSKMRSAIY